MSDISADRRLELIRTVREEQARNHMTMRRRESILYGSGAASVVVPEGGAAVPSGGHTGIKIRILLALVLFLAFLIMDKNEVFVFNVGAGDIYGYIAASADSFDFIRDFTYTLND